MRRFNKEQKLFASQYIDNLLIKYNIKADITQNGQAGRAMQYEESCNPKIKIPRPITPFKFGTGLHEIGHIVLGHCVAKKGILISKKPSYIEEYEAEQFAIKKLKELRFYTREYEIEAIRYVLENIAQAFNRKHNLNKVPKKIIKWTGLKINTWKKSKKIFVPRGQNINSKKNIVIQFLFEGNNFYVNKLNR